MESALREREPRVVVESVALAGGHSGTTTRQRLRIRVREADVPPSLFVKVTPMGVPQRVFGHAMRLGEMEVRFYRELAGEVPVRVPRVYTARASRSYARFVLLLEDVAQSGATLVDVGERATVAHARSVVRALAVLHAAYWESPRFEAGLAWLRCRERPARERSLETLLTAQMLSRSTRLAGSLRTNTFDRLGYAKASTPAICGRAGVSRGAQLHHFPTKAQLVTDAIEHPFARRHTQFRELLVTEPDLDRAPEALWDIYAGDSLYAWMELLVAARTDEALRTHLREVDDRFFAEAKLTCRRLLGLPAGNDAKVAALARLILSVVDGLALNTLGGREELTAAVLSNLRVALAAAMTEA